MGRISLDFHVFHVFQRSHIILAMALSVGDERACSITSAWQTPYEERLYRETGNTKVECGTLLACRRIDRPLHGTHGNGSVDAEVALLVRARG